MKEKIGEVFSIAKDNQTVKGCTISKAIQEGRNSIIYFSLAAGTDISAEVFPYHKLILVAEGSLEVYGDNHYVRTLTAGDSIVTLTDTPMGMRTTSGAIYTETYLTDSKSTFAKNKAISVSEDAEGNGGAVYLNTLPATSKKTLSKFTSTKFYGNEASDKGGAVFVGTEDYDSTSTKVTFNKNTFGSTNATNPGNKANQGGGLYNQNGDLTFSSTNFYSNKANDKGGALYNADNGIITLTKGNFGSYTKKTDSVSGGNDAVYGGAIYSTGKTLSSTSNTFSGNSAVQGGALYTANPESATSNVTIKKATFRKNYAKKKSNVDVEDVAGGAIYNDTSLALSNSNFIGNYAYAGKGGAIYNGENAKDITISKTKFTSNDALYGNAIYNDGSIKSIASSTFKSNKSSSGNSYGGAIYNNGATAVITEIKGSTFTNNQATYGGAIFNNILGEIGTLTKVTIGNAKKNTYANIADNGGAIYNAGHIAKIASSILSRNQARKAGGAIYNTGVIDSIVSTAMSYETVTNGAGGAIYNATGAVIGSIDRASAMKGNSVTNGNGGAIYNDGEITINGATLASNKVTNGLGGAIYNGVNGVVEFNNVSSGKKTYTTTFSSNTAKEGGAIYNEGEMNVQAANYTSNKATSEVTGGGAIYNKGKVMSVEAASKFTGNTAANGGAIYNEGEGSLTLEKVTFGDAKKDKLGNKATLNGGAIYNKGTVSIADSVLSRNSAGANGGVIYSDINSSVILENETLSANKATLNGGAIYTMGSLVADNNVTFSSNSAVSGGAIFAKDNASVNISESKFTSNKATTGDGGAIALLTASTIENQISAEFTNNTAYKGKGGAIYNAGNLKLGDTTFTNNFAMIGGSIYNDNGAILTIGEAVRFIFSPAKKTKYTYTSQGGAIYNNGVLNIAGNDSITLSGIKVTNDGGVIYNDEFGVISILNRNMELIFENNSAGKNGGAIYNNKGTITLANTQFKSNSAENGGAVYNTGTLSIDDTVEFDGNKATKSGGIIHNSSVLNVIGSSADKKVEFKGSSAQRGGAISSGYTSDATGSKLYVENAVFDSNIVKNSSGTEGSYGGAIYNGNAGTNNKNTIIKNSDFLNNQSNGNGKSTALGGGGAIYNAEGAVIADDNGGAGLTESTFSQNSTKIDGGAIYNNGTIVMENNEFADNKATKSGGAIYNYKSGSITVSNTNSTKYGFDGNEAGTAGGAIYSSGKLTSTSVEYKENSVTAKGGKGGAIYTSGEFGSKSDTFTGNKATYGAAIYVDGGKFSTNVITEANFVDNISTSGGGGIYIADSTKSNVKELVINKSTFTGNQATNASGGALYVGNYSHARIIDTNMTNNSASSYGGAIYAGTDSIVDIIAKTQDVNIKNNTSYDGSDVYLAARATLNLDAYTGKTIDIGKISIINTAIGKNDAPKIEYWGDGTIKIGNQADLSNIINHQHEDSHIDIANENSLLGASFVYSGTSSTGLSNGRIGKLMLKSVTYTSNDSANNLSIDMDLKNGTSDQVSAETIEGNGTMNVSSVNMISDSKKAVTITVADEDSAINNVSARSAESRRATYQLKTIKDNNGIIRTVAYGQKAKPAVVSAPVAAQIGGYLTQINSYDQAFANLDMEMLQTRAEREANDRMNKYALQSGTPVHYENGVTTDGKGLWNRAYATFEKVNLSGGPNVSNIGYGNFFGGDMGKKELNNGWKRQFSAYIGYNGSTQDYEKQSIDQNGGTLGVMETWYKGNFFTAVTANVGANHADASTDIGKERMAMLMAGIASKTGYNFEFKDGKYIIQPNLLISYSYIQTFGHKNGLGDHVGSNPIHGLQVAPGVKFIANLKNGWQPYLGINMRWNIMDKSHFSIPDVTIPEMSVKPYVEYGIGLQKRWGERFTGYGQAMIRNGGRNGVMLSIGFRWAIGK